MYKVLLSIIVAVAFGVLLSAVSHAEEICQTPQQQNCTQPPPCGEPGAPNCHPSGQPICTGAGCYQMHCNAFGCNLVFTPHPPFGPGEQME